MRAQLKIHSQAQGRGKIRLEQKHGPLQPPCRKFCSRAAKTFTIVVPKMKSMTGYGCGECAQNGHKVTVELSSVNRKQSEISINLPRDLEPLEAQIRDQINRAVSRGRFLVRVALHTTEGRLGNQPRLNASLARAYVREFQKLAKELHLEGPVTLDLLLRAPGVLQPDDDPGDAEDFWPAVHGALSKALDGLVSMRKREGAHLGKDLRHRMKLIEVAIGRIERQAPLVQKRYRKNLLHRIRSAGLDLRELDDERLMKEVVLFADRSDISEELTRLKSHFKQFEECLKSKDPVGRTLDFLSQEMNREINTIGAKANDSLISSQVVIVKAELEKFREQVQNVE
jgi:uncharacterized protein (TIGR00255 family)